MTRFIVPTLKPRNPLVALSHQRRAGAHRRGSSGLRQRAERGLRRELLALVDQRHSP
jgi:hypothetical protein